MTYITKLGNKLYRFENKSDRDSAIKIMEELQETLESKMNEHLIDFEPMKFPPCDGSNEE